MEFTMSDAAERELQLIHDSIKRVFELLEIQAANLSRIEAQTIKTNGRVNRLEEKHEECPIKSLESIIAKEKNPELKKRELIGTVVLSVVATVTFLAVIIGIFESLAH